MFYVFVVALLTEILGGVIYGILWIKERLSNIFRSLFIFQSPNKRVLFEIYGKKRNEGKLTFPLFGLREKDK